jgi:hypothetical protein
MRAPFDANPLPLAGRLAAALVLLLAGGTARAQEGVRQPPAELQRRLEAAEARIEQLEELVRSLVEQAARDRVVPVTEQRPAPQQTDARAAAKAEPRATPAPGSAPGSVTLSGLVQAWYSASNESVRDSFRIRRAELYFSGEITKKARWQVMVDPSKALVLETTSAPVGGSSVLTSASVSQASRALQNAFVSLDYVPRVHLNVGQFKLPLSLEGQQSSGKLETVERALFLSDRARGGAYGDVRDIGLLGRGSLGSHVDVQAGIFNGVAETQNGVDGNDQKALAGSLVARLAKGLQVGGSGAWGNGGGDRPRRDRLGADLLFTQGAFTLKSEVMAGHDGPLSRRGYYGHVGYRFMPRLEAVFRVDTWDPDTSSESTSTSALERDYVAGFNLLLNQHNLKLQLNYLRKTFPSDLLPARNVFLVNTQTFW